MTAPQAPSAVATLAAVVEGHGLIRLSRPEIAAFRRRPDPLPAPWPPCRPSTLRHSDEQTVAAVAAVRQALENMGSPNANRFEDWGVVAASRFLGRSNLVLALDRFKVEGPWGVSPHLIPHFALHAQAGALSLVLSGRGPNLGAGGGGFAGTDGVLTALSWLDSGLVPGVWLVLTHWDPEYRPDLDGEPIEPTHCEALALALSPNRDDGGWTRIQMAESSEPVGPSPATAATIGEGLTRHLGSEPIPVGTDAEGRFLVELVSTEPEPEPKGGAA